jgi:DNA-binding MarR family transcriptional regulator
MQKNDGLIQIISNINQVMKSYIKSEFTKKGINATPTQTAVLYLLEQKDGQKISDFASSLEVKNPVMTGVIDRMEKAGLIIRKLDPADRRIISIFITPQGREESAKAKLIIRRMNKKIELSLHTQEIEICKKVLNHLYKEISQLEMS